MDVVMKDMAIVKGPDGAVYVISNPVAATLKETATDIELSAWCYLKIDRNNQVKKIRI